MVKTNGNEIQIKVDTKADLEVSIMVHDIFQNGKEIEEFTSLIV